MAERQRVGEILARGTAVAMVAGGGVLTGWEVYDLYANVNPVIRRTENDLNQRYPLVDTRLDSAEKERREKVRRSILSPLERKQFSEQLLSVAGVIVAVFGIATWMDLGEQKKNSLEVRTAVSSENTL